MGGKRRTDDHSEKCWISGVLWSTTAHSIPSPFYSLPPNLPGLGPDDDTVSPDAPSSCLRTSTD